MSEGYLDNPTKNDVIEAWKIVSAQGYSDPDEISELITGMPETEEMLAAEKLYYKWYENEKAKTKTPEEELRFRFETTMLYVEAGFTGHDYLDEVANDWLVQDTEAAEEQGFTELAFHIKTKIDEINNLLGNI